MLKWVERHFMRRKPRANSLTYRSKKKDAVKMHMSFDLEPDSVQITPNFNTNINSTEEEDSNNNNNISNNNDESTNDENDNSFFVPQLEKNLLHKLIMKEFEE